MTQHSKTVTGRKSDKILKLTGSIWIKWVFIKPYWFAESATTHRRAAALDSAEIFVVLTSSWHCKVPRRHLVRTPGTWPKLASFRPETHWQASYARQLVWPPACSQVSLSRFLLQEPFCFANQKLTGSPASQVNAPHLWYIYSRRLLSCSSWEKQANKQGVLKCLGFISAKRVSIYTYYRSNNINKTI